MTQAVIYARFSPRRNEDEEKRLRAERPEEERDSISKQLARCREFCAKRGWRVLSEHTDEALSGAEEDRPGLWDAVAALTKNSVLVIDKMDRLARDKYLFCLIEQEVTKKRATIVSVAGEGTEGNSAESELIRTIMQALAVYQRRIIKARTAAAMRRHQANGRRMGRSDRCPYGWQVHPADASRLIESPEERDVIERIKAERRAGRGLREIGRTLDEAGILCRGKRWSHSAVRSVLRRAGQLVEV